MFFFGGVVSQVNADKFVLDVVGVEGVIRDAHSGKQVQCPDRIGFDRDPFQAVVAKAIEHPDIGAGVIRGTQEVFYAIGRFSQ